MELKMADPSVDFQTLASNHNIIYEKEEVMFDSQYWVWNVDNLSNINIINFFIDADTNGFINSEQMGLSIIPDTPLAIDTKLKIPTI